MKHKPIFTFELEGNQNAKVMAIFIHGFPDTTRLWDPIIADLDQSSLLIVNLTYYVDEYFGIDMAEVVNRCHRTITNIDGGRNLKKILIGHDWGAIFGYYIDYQYPTFLDEFVCLDVTIGWPSNLPARILILFFHSILVIVWLLTIAAPFLLFAPMALFYLISRCLRGQDNKFWTLNPAKLTYPYGRFYLQKGFGTFKWVKANCDNYKPSCPITYIYGKNKPVMIHTDKFLKQITSLPNSQVIPVAGGHWFMNRNKTLIITKIMEAAKRINAIR